MHGLELILTIVCTTKKRIFGHFFNQPKFFLKFEIISSVCKQVSSNLKSCIISLFQYFSVQLC